MTSFIDEPAIFSSRRTRSVGSQPKGVATELSDYVPKPSLLNRRMVSNTSARSSA